MRFKISQRFKSLTPTIERSNRGFTLVELLIVIVILGILATVTVFAVRGITDKGTTSACNSDKVTLQTAAESYFAQYGGTTIQANSLALPGGSSLIAGSTPAQTLINAGYIRALPANYDVTASGSLTYKTATCGTLNAAVPGT